VVASGWQEGVLFYGCSPGLASHRPTYVSVMPQTKRLRSMETAPRNGMLIWIKFRGVPGAVVGYWSIRLGLGVDDRDGGRARLDLVPEGWFPPDSPPGVGQWPQRD
jgi:hypothetical protein